MARGFLNQAKRIKLEAFDTTISDLLVLATAAMGVSAIPGFFFRKKHPTLLHCIAAVFMLLVGAWTIACALEASSVGLAAKIKKYRTEYVSQADSPAHYAALFYGRLAMGALIAGLGLAALVVKIKENLPSKKHDKLIVFIRRRQHAAPKKSKGQRGRT
jgi:hypothetical protein